MLCLKNVHVQKKCFDLVETFPPPGKLNWNSCFKYLHYVWHYQCSLLLVFFFFFLHTSTLWDTVKTATRVLLRLVYIEGETGSCWVWSTAGSYHQRSTCLVVSTWSWTWFSQWFLHSTAPLLPQVRGKMQWTVGLKLKFTLIFTLEESCSMILRFRCKLQAGWGAKPPALS